LLFLLAGFVRVHTQYKYREDQKTRLSELGNLTQSIFLSLRQMSIVKIRAGSLFYNTAPRIGAADTGFQVQLAVFPHDSTAAAMASQVVHRGGSIGACRKATRGSKVRE
jgi:hypothetical protein